VISISLFIFILLVGFGAGAFTVGKMRPPKTPVELPPVTDYTIQHALESYAKIVQEGWDAIYPKHDDDCDCAQCEIQYGTLEQRIAARSVAKQLTNGVSITRAPGEPGQVGSYHPDYVEKLKEDRNALQERIDGLTHDRQQLTEAVKSYAKRNKELQDMVDQRDRARADIVNNAYQAGRRGDDVIVKHGGEIVQFIPNHGGRISVETC
jgi:hypothetical protein